jgi:hypothetical protein
VLDTFDFSWPNNELLFLALQQRMACVLLLLLKIYAACGMEATLSGISTGNTHRTRWRTAFLIQARRDIDTERGKTSFGRAAWY